MKKKRLSILLVAIATSAIQLFADTTPQAGKVYRIHNYKSEQVISENSIARELVSAAPAGDEDLRQLWLLKANGAGFSFQNAYSGQYIQHNPTQSASYTTGTSEAALSLDQKGSAKYAIKQGDRSFFHSDPGNNIVRWWDSSTEASHWKFEEVNVSQESISLQQAAFRELYETYQERLGLMEDIDEYNAKLPTFFVDSACTALKDTYADMSDDELRSAMSELPASLQDIAIKVKNEAWGHREKEFRIRQYKAYSDPDYWAEVLYTKKYSRINNPTGVYGNEGDMLYVFVANDIPQGATLTAEVICGSGIQGEATTLTRGLNMIPTVKDYSNLFIRYVGETSLEGTTLITDYPELTIHVEEGIVNGFWNKEEHDDADWVDMMNNLATGDMFQVKGERIMFHMSKHYIKECCPNAITDAIGWWDNMTRWQQDMLGIEDVRLKKFNNLGCAISLTSGYQSATHYRTQYAETYIKNLLPYEKMMSNADNCWGPAHENGHVHQAAIQSVGTAEVSNNFFSNLTLNKLGKYVSRGEANSTIFADYGEHVPYILRDGASTMRSFWQLYLYFHEAQVDPTFYPRVLKAMRETPMKARDPKYYAMSVYANEDLLLFAKVCCDVAQLDLSEFFRFWGYLELTNKQHIGDYGDFYLTTRQKDVDEFLAHVSQYPKAPSIIFIEDRVKPVLRTDGVEGYKENHGNAISNDKAGDVGHYTDFMDKTVKAEGYIYEKNNDKIIIKGGSGALGFKVYTKDNGTLVTGSNHLSFKLPKGYTMRDIIVVAAQADGTDMRIPSLAEAGTEEQQRDILDKTLALAKEYVVQTDSTGKKIGLFYPDSVADLKELVEYADQVILNSDQSEYTYGALAMNLDSAINYLHNSPTARVPFIPNCFYSLSPRNNEERYIGYASVGLTTSAAEEATDELQWKFIPAGNDDTYYIQHRTTGKYITTAKQSELVKAASNDIAEAVAFRLVIDGPGEFLIQHADQEDNNLYTSSALVNMVYMTKNGCKWTISMEDNLLGMPEASTDEEIIVYSFVRDDNNEYAWYKNFGRFDKGRLSSSTPDSPEDPTFWFYFYEGNEEGKYLIYNFQSRMPVTIATDKALWANMEAATLPEFSLTLTAEGTGMTVATEEGSWYVDSISGLTLLSDKDSTVWKLQRVCTISLTYEPLTSLALELSKATLNEGDSIRLKVETAPIYATDHTVTWSSSDNSIAMVDSTGMVKAIAAGTATITATANDNPKLSAKCRITVNKAESGIDTAEKETFTIESQGDGTITISGLANGTVVSLYDVVGKQIATATASEGTAIITTSLSKGSIAILKVGGECKKVYMQ